MTGPPALDPGGERDGHVIARSLEHPELFARLYDRYAPDIHRYAARRLGDHAADDVTADTFLTAFRVRARYDASRASARPWLYGIAAHFIGKQRRKEVRGLRALARTGQDPVAGLGRGHGGPGRRPRPARGRARRAVRRRQACAAARGLGRPDLPGGRRGARHTRRDRAVPAQPGPPQGTGLAGC